MGFLFREPRLLPGEAESWRARANRAQGWRAVGGSLHLTNQRIVFMPHHVETRSGGQRWERPLADVRAAGEAPRSLRAVFAGGMRTRLRLTLADETEELFVVSSPAEVAARVDAAVRGASPGTHAAPG